MNTNRFFANFGKLVLVIVIVAVVVTGAFYLGSKNQQKPTSIPQPQTQSNNTPSVITPTESLIPSPTFDETDALKITIKSALVAEHGSVANDLNITVSRIEGDYASGQASAQGGGGLWFASKAGGGVWKLVWDGNGIIQCSNLTNYPNFPTSMIPQCFNAQTQAMVTR